MKLWLFWSCTCRKWTNFVLDIKGYGEFQTQRFMYNFFRQSCIKKMCCLDFLVHFSFENVTLSGHSCPKSRELYFVSRFLSIYRKVQILWVVDVSKPSSMPNNFSLHNINYRKLCFIEKYTNNSETKWI